MRDTVLLLPQSVHRCLHADTHVTSKNPAIREDVNDKLQEGYEVTAVDNLSEGHLENIAHLKNDKRFRFAKLDLKDRGAAMKAVKGNDVVFHMAAQANIRKSIVDHRGDLENNLMAMINILDGMVEHKVTDLVGLASSDLVHNAAVQREAK